MKIRCVMNECVFECLNERTILLLFHVVAVTAFKVDNLAIAFKGYDVGAHSVQKPTIVRDHNDTACCVLYAHNNKTRVQSSSPNGEPFSI